MKNINEKRLSIPEINQKQEKLKKFIEEIDQWIIKIISSYEKDLPNKKDPDHINKTIAFNKLVKAETDLLLAIKQSALEQNADLEKLQEDFRQTISRIKPEQNN